MTVAKTYEPSDPCSWSPSAASGFVMGLDIGLFSDHSALVVGGVWPQANGTIGIIEVVQFEIGEPLTKVAEEAAGLAIKHNAKICCDLSNNSAFASIIAPSMGRNPADRLNVCSITGAHQHAIVPTPMPIALGSYKAVIPRWTLSKRELIETLSAEFSANTLRVGKTGAWEALFHELHSLQREARQSGSVDFKPPAGRHDDLIIALSLCVFMLRRLGGVTRARSREKRHAQASSAGWT
jgi:hypothetical protein